MWRGVRRLVSLVHGWDDVRQVYGDNPNDLPEVQRLTGRAVGSDIANNGGAYSTRQ